MVSRRALMERPRLSRTPSATTWLKQFRAADQLAAVSLLDSLLLLNDDDIASSIRSQLRKLAKVRTGPARKLRYTLNESSPRPLCSNPCGTQVKTESRE